MLITHTAQNIDVSLDFLVRKFCGNTQFLQGFERISQKVHKVSTPINQVKLLYFMQWQNATPYPPLVVSLHFAQVISDDSCQQIKFFKVFQWNYVFGNSIGFITRSVAFVLSILFFFFCVHVVEWQWNVRNMFIFSFFSQNFCAWVFSWCDFICS